MEKTHFTLMSICKMILEWNSHFGEGPHFSECARASKALQHGFVERYDNYCVMTVTSLIHQIALFTIGCCHLKR